MKNRLQLVLPLALFVFISTFVFGQNMPKRYATLELFTNTPCGSCQSQNPGFFSRLADFQQDVHQISFYPGSPYQSCPIYQANSGENLDHKARRGNIFTPQVFINGGNETNSGSVSTAMLSGLTGDESFLYVKVEETSSLNRDVMLTLQTVESAPTTTGQLYVAIVEREYTIPNAQSNWEADHYNVFRSWISNGETVDLTAASQTLNYSYTVDSEWDENQVYVLAWVENPTDESVYNSGTRFDEAFSATNEIKAATEVAVYPNPVIDEITMDLPADFDVQRIELFDVQGRMVSVFDNKNINVAHLASGQYALVAWSNNNDTIKANFVKK